MNQKKTTPAPAHGITLEEVYYVLFRYKWLILAIMAVAGGAAAFVRSQATQMYQSEAALMIRYVSDTHLSQELGNERETPQGTLTGEAVINSEIETLHSADLASNVVEALTPEKILAKLGGGSDRQRAIYVVRTNFEVVPTKSFVVKLLFNHPDPDIVQPILTQLIAAYEAKHQSIHNPSVEDPLTRQRDAAKARMATAEQMLLEIEKTNNIHGDGDQQRINSDLIGELKGKIIEADSELASYVERINLLKAGSAAANSNQSATSAPAKLPSLAEVPRSAVSHYKELSKHLATLEAEGEKLRSEYKDTVPAVLANAAEVKAAEDQKNKLEEQYPALIGTQVSTAPAGLAADDPRTELSRYETLAVGLQARIKSLTNNLAIAMRDADNLASCEGRIRELKHERDSAEADLSVYEKKLSEQTAMRGEGAFNIAPVENPTPAAHVAGTTDKIAMGILGAGIVLALLIPFAIERVLDRSLKRESDVKSRIPQYPFFLTIPYKKMNGHRRQLKNAKAPTPAPAPEENGEPGPIIPVTPGTPMVWEEGSDLHPFHETLRDRLITYFDMINLTHKPKLVAVTSCAEGAGVTSTAAGLASSLSETGDGNVLLVNMNARDGEAHHFYKGKLTCGLDEMLEKGASGEGVTGRSNLYVAKEEAEDERLPRLLPKRFNHLFPKMKASDFDYIIFDMPPVSQISITPRLARFMDMVLLVVESGKTNRDVAKHAADLLGESKTNVGLVLNKNRSYVPQALHPEL